MVCNYRDLEMYYLFFFFQKINFLRVLKYVVVVHKLSPIIITLLSDYLILHMYIKIHDILGTPNVPYRRSKRKTYTES